MAIEHARARLGLSRRRGDEIKFAPLSYFILKDTDFEQ